MPSILWFRLFLFFSFFPPPTGVTDEEDPNATRQSGGNYLPWRTNPRGRRQANMTEEEGRVEGMGTISHQTCNLHEHDSVAVVALFIWAVFLSLFSKRKKKNSTRRMGTRKNGRACRIPSPLVLSRERRNLWVARLASQASPTAAFFFFFSSILFSWSDGRDKLCVVKKRKRLIKMYLFF